MASSEEIRKMTDFLQQMKGGKLQQKQADFDKQSYSDYLGAYGQSQEDWQGRQTAYQAAQAKYQADYGNYLNESNRRLDTYEGQNQGLINTYRGQLATDTAAYGNLVSDYNTSLSDWQTRKQAYDYGQADYGGYFSIMTYKDAQGNNRLAQALGHFPKGTKVDANINNKLQTEFNTNYKNAPAPGVQPTHPGAFTAPNPPNIPDFQGLPDPVQFTGTDPGAAPTFAYESPVSPYASSISKLANQTKLNARSSFTPATPSWDIWKNAYGMYGQG